MLGVSAHQIGRRANEHQLKTEAYGKVFMDKSPYSSKQVESFRYIADGLIEINPVAQISAARYYMKENATSSEYIVDPFTPDEIAAIYSSCTNKQHENLFRFAYHTGMRSSELCAIRWSDIDLNEKVAHVQQARVEGFLKETKTRAGKRKIELDEEALSALSDQKAYTFKKGEHIFSDPKTCLPWAGADAIRKKAWVPILKRAGVRYRNPYQTRHTFATRHISKGVNLFWLSRQMGHKGPEMLFRHYGGYLADYDGHTTNKKSSPGKTGK